jgi:response regulator RpfG family c-di-GMP phosphodiesterase
LHSAVDFPYGHHEKLDGGSCLHGLGAQQVHLPAHLSAVADVPAVLILGRLYPNAQNINAQTSFPPTIIGYNLNIRFNLAFEV